MGGLGIPFSVGGGLLRIRVPRHGGSGPDLSRASLGLPSVCHAAKEHIPRGVTGMEAIGSPPHLGIRKRFQLITTNSGQRMSGPSSPHRAGLALSSHPHLFSVSHLHIPAPLQRTATCPPLHSLIPVLLISGPLLPLWPFKVYFQTKTPLRKRRQLPVLRTTCFTALL